MNSLIRKSGYGLLAGLALLGISCTQNDDGKLITSSAPASAAPTPQSATPKPVASVALADGHAIEFYDFGPGVLVSESGKAGTPAVFTKENNPADLLQSAATPGDRLALIWKKAAPSAPVPQALLDIQARWLKNPPAPSSAGQALPISHEASGMPFGQTPVQSQALAKTESPVGCNNGCCDYQWLSTFSECSANYDYRWFLYNYGWSYANSSSISVYDGMVCAANGYSQFNVHISDGHGGNWSVPPATYRTYWWVSGIFEFNQSMTSSVNSSSNSHLHTYCGGVFH